LNHEADALNHEAEVQNHEADALNHEAEVQNHETDALNHEAEVPNYEADALNSEPKFRTTKLPFQCLPEGQFIFSKYPLPILHLKDLF